MAFTVETGAGLANANAFVSVADFKAYCDLRGLGYSDYSDAQIEQAIVRATDYLSNSFAWQGWRVKERGASGGAQALAWPRVSVVDGAGYSVPSTSLPVELVQATSEIAFYELGNNRAMAPAYTPHERIKVEKLGPMMTEYDLSRLDADGARPELLAVRDLIGQFLERGGRASRLSAEGVRG